MIECRLVSSKRQTAFGGLCVLGRYLTDEGVLEPLSSVKVAQKSVEHSPAQKLTDALMGILCGCKAIYETNVRVRPDVPLQSRPLDASVWPSSPPSRGLSTPLRSTM